MTSLLSDVPLTALAVNIGGIHTGSRSVPCRFLRGKGAHGEVERGRGRDEGPVGTSVTAVGQDAGIVHHVTVKFLTAQHSVSVLTTYNVTNNSHHKPHVTAKEGDNVNKLYTVLCTQVMTFLLFANSYYDLKNKKN